MITSDNEYWIGLNDIASEDDWLWVNGQIALRRDVTLWYPNEPNNADGNEDCAFVYFSTIHGNFAWDAFCSLEKKAVCEKPIKL